MFFYITTFEQGASKIFIAAVFISKPIMISQALQN